MAVLTRAGPGRAPRFPLLDSVRAVAALSVVVYHANFLSHIDRTGSAAAPFLSRMDVGVTIFFLLSGFLLYRPFVRARLAGEDGPSTAAYAWRRALRILPAYWVALTVLSLALGQTDTFRPAHAVAYYGLGQIYTDVALGGIAQAWTLCVEVTFYALLPLWALALRRLGAPRTPRAELIALAGLFAVGVVWNVAWTVTAGDPRHANTARALVWLPAYLDHFAIGMALAVASVAAERGGRLPRPLAWLERRAWPAWLVALAAFVVVAKGVGLSPVNALEAPTTAAAFLARHWLYALVALGVLLPAAFGPPDRGAIRRALGHPVTLYLGVVSYGVYLWHVGVMSLVLKQRPGLSGGSWGDMLALLAIGVLGGVLVASLSWRLIEKPILRLKRLVPDRALPLRDPETHVPREQPVSAGSGD